MSHDRSVLFWRVAFLLITVSFMYSQVQLYEYRDATNDALWELKLYTWRYETCIATLDYHRDLLAEYWYEENKHWLGNISTTNISNMYFIQDGINQTEWEIRYREEQ